MGLRSDLAAAGVAFALASTALAQGGLVDVVEFYNTTLDHYFISSLSADITALDSGALKGWSRTGLGFKAYDQPTGNASPVCRFYMPPASGDSHFYSASPAECATVATKFPTFSYESPSVMYVGLPDATTGACAPEFTPVYRLWNQRADSNHRYTTDRDVRAAMIAKGYLAEGYGPDGVAMCAPSADKTFTVTLSAVSMLLESGESRDLYVTVQPRGGYAGAVSVALSGVPAAVAQQVAAPTLSVGPGPASTLVHFTVAASAAPTASPATVIISATDASGTGASAPLSLGIAAPGDPIAGRLRAVAAVEEKCVELDQPGVAPLAYLEAVAAFMATRPEYVASGVDAETLSAWGQFSDGRVHIVVANREPGPRASLVSAVPTPQRTPKEGAELPFATKARLLHSFGPNFESQTPIDQMRSYLGKRGWTVRAGAEGDAHVDTLKGVGGDGFLYINTHGGRARVSDPSEPEGKMYAIQSSTLKDAAHEQAYDADLKALRLVDFTAPNGDSIVVNGQVRNAKDTRYGITYRFVETYMSFMNESVVLINACYSTRNALFVTAFLKKGAGVYLGWLEGLTAETAYEAAPYFVDRMVGANENPRKESPPQRPFAYDLVLADMAAKGLDVDKKSGGKLQPITRTGLLFPPIFAPSIRYVYANEYEDTITLVGEFGQERPKVTVGGTEATVNHWSATEIEAQLQRTGAGSSGDVIVEIRGVRSNARQLSEWPVPLRYLWTKAYDVPNHQFEGSGTIRYRADVAGFRLAPAQPLQYRPTASFPTRDSRFELTASGSYTSGGCTSALSGSATYLSPPALGGVAGDVLATAMRIAGDTRQVALGLGYGSLEFKHKVTYSGPSGCASGSYPRAPTFGLLDGVEDLPIDPTGKGAPLPLPSIKFALDANFGMPFVMRSYDPSGGTIIVSWTAVPAKTPPRDTEDAGK